MRGFAILCDLYTLHAPFWMNDDDDEGVLAFLRFGDFGFEEKQGEGFNERG
jgi:hypothetical protein